MSEVRKVTVTPGAWYLIAVVLGLPLMAAIWLSSYAFSSPPRVSFTPLRQVYDVNIISPCRKLP